MNVQLAPLATRFHSTIGAGRLPAELEPKHTLGWDREHLAAWATGEATNEPGHDFHCYAGGQG